ncbi:MAG: glycosyltransferase family 4 protein [Chthoniobacterales bacterium]|nr:glycosyltransferase family 4 protein [Chthoniobacterales bacterium]
MKIALLTTDSREHFKDYANPQPYFGAAPTALLDGLNFHAKRAEVHVVSCLQQAPVMSPTKIADNIFYHGLHVPKAGWMRTGYQGCVRATRARLAEIKPDIVHGQGTERDCALCAALSGYPSLVTVHGVMRAIQKLTQSRPLSYYWFARHFETFALHRTAGVIAISPYVDALVSPLTPRTWLIPNAVQEFFFAPAPGRRRQSGAARLVNVGVISPRKRQVELLERLSELRRVADFEITFVGKANPGEPYADNFVSLLNSCQAKYGGFAHVPFFDEREFLELYDSADAMIHFSNEESFGLTFAEALARNLPLFASDVGAIRQIGEGLPECRIFGTQDFVGLMSSLQAWIASGSYEHDRAAAPHPLIKSRYHPAVIAERHLAVYETVVAGR